MLITKNADGFVMQMVRGDSDTITVSIPKKPLTNGATVTLTVRSVPSNEKVLTKTVTSFTDGKAVINIVPSDTSNLQFSKPIPGSYTNGVGRYIFDIECRYTDTDVKTVCKGVFILDWEATYNG